MLRSRLLEDPLQGLAGGIQFLRVFADQLDIVQRLRYHGLGKIAEQILHLPPRRVAARPFEDAVIEHLDGQWSAVEQLLHMFQGRLELGVEQHHQAAQLGQGG